MQSITTLAIGAALLAPFLLTADGQNPKPKTPQPKTGVQGAVQMPGDNGKVGTQYQLGKKGEELVFTLEKAEFASRYFHSRDGLFPDVGKRLLVLTYAVQNPAAVDRHFSNQTFSFTVVSPDDENYVCDGISGNGLAGLHPDRRDPLNLYLKPAQKVRAVVAIEMHPKGPVNKVIVQKGKGTPVLRYDLKEKVAAQSGAFAEPDGQSMREVGAGWLETTADLGPWDITVEKVEDVPLAIGDHGVDPGHKYIACTVQIRNASMTPYPLTNNLILSKVTDIDGSDLPESRVWVKASTPENFAFTTVAPGAAVRVRMLFHTSLLTKADTLQLRDQQYSGRSVAIKLEKQKKDG